MESPTSIVEPFARPRLLSGAFLLATLPRADSKPTEEKTENTDQTVPLQVDRTLVLHDDLVLNVWSYLTSSELNTVVVASRAWSVLSKSNPQAVQTLWKLHYFAACESPPCGYFNDTKLDETDRCWKKNYLKRTRTSFAWMRRSSVVSCIPPRRNLIVANTNAEETELLESATKQRFQGERTLRVESFSKALLVSENYDRIILGLGTYQVPHGMFIHKTLEVVGVGLHPSDVKLLNPAFIIRESASVRFSHVTFVEACITIPKYSNSNGWVQMDDCVFEKSQFVEIGHDSNFLTRHFFAGKFSRCLLVKPTYPSEDYKDRFDQKGERKQDKNIHRGDIVYGSYDVEFL